MADMFQPAKQATSQTIAKIGRSFGRMDEMELQLSFSFTCHLPISVLTSLLFQCISATSAGTSVIMCSICSGCAFELLATFCVKVIIVAIATIEYML